MINNVEPSYLLRAGQYCFTDCGSKLTLEISEKKLVKAGQSYRQLSKRPKRKEISETNKQNNRTKYKIREILAGQTNRQSKRITEKDETKFREQTKQFQNTGKFFGEQLAIAEK